MNWPQIAMLMLYAISIGIALAKDGQPREGKESFGKTCFACAVGMYILYCGGFWSCL